ncbi:MAG: hypothetical protein QG570_466 [Patescibacteria group bacterium]|nr:hypothetical protein [Patescibacteria group bacterium]
MYKNLFLPNPVDKKRPRLIQPKFLVGYMLFLAFFVGGSSFMVVQNPDILGYATNISTQELLSFTNKVRNNSGLESLKLNSLLSKAAENKAKHMFANNYWAHTAPDGTEPWDFIISSGYSYTYAGENLAVDFSDSDDVVNAWVKSPTHKDNLLNKNYSEIGFAVVDGELEGRKTTLVVQMFGKPRYSQPAVAVPDEKSAGVEPVISEAEINKRIVEENPSQLVEDATDVNPNPTLVTEDIAYQFAFDEAEIAEGGGSVLNANDIFSVSKYIALILGLFVTLTFAIDGYAVRKAGMLRVTGHTVLHIGFLVLVIVGIWYTNIGLVL